MPRIIKIPIPDVIIVALGDQSKVGWLDQESMSWFFGWVGGRLRLALLLQVSNEKEWVGWISN